VCVQELKLRNSVNTSIKPVKTITRQIKNTTSSIFPCQYFDQLHNLIEFTLRAKKRPSFEGLVGPII
jgi:hypothetical protein